MNCAAKSTIYPVTCPGCNTINSQRASQILEKPYVHCRQCSTVITLSEAQLNKVRRTVAELRECLERAPCPAVVSKTEEEV